MNRKSKLLLKRALNKRRSINFPINMYDPTRDFKSFEADYRVEINNVLNHGRFINGIEVKELENNLSKYVGAKHCITCGNGTDALQIALMALGVKHGDEVITVPHTWISTSEVISLLGAIPVFCDIEQDTFNMDINCLEGLITPETKAILPVSLYGHMPDYEKINEIAAKHGISVIEDGAQSFGATQNEKKSCNTTLVGCTSFFPSKPLGCFGDGGAMFTNDDDLAMKLRAIKSHGGVKRFHHDYIGVNSRLDTLQAGILKVKLHNFDLSLTRRSQVAMKYNDKLANLKGLELPVIKENNTHAWAQYSLLCPSKDVRDKLVVELGMKEVNVSIFYPVPLHHQKCFEYLNYQKGDFPVCEKVCDTIINLPCYAELTNEEQTYIINAFRVAYNDLVAE
jgi:UDP-2-acetamido-2-deoxy-ribo-hexuluronate aminotransferase